MTIASKGCIFICESDIKLSAVDSDDTIMGMVPKLEKINIRTFEGLQEYLYSPVRKNQVVVAIKNLNIQRKKISTTTRILDFLSAEEHVAVQNDKASRSYCIETALRSANFKIPSFGYASYKTLLSLWDSYQPVPGCVIMSENSENHLWVSEFDLKESFSPLCQCHHDQQ